MSRILVINPNSSTPCGDGISAALDPFRFPGGPRLDVVTLADGPPGIYSWQDWHAAVEPLCRIVAADAAGETRADAYVIACASDPGIDAVRALTPRPVLGVFRCAVASALAQAERFGVVALAEASKGRHLLALRSMGVEPRLAGEIAMNVSLESLLDAEAARERLIATAGALVDAGAGVVILGCTGMSGHRAAMEAAIGVRVIDPCQAAAALAIGLMGGAASSVAREKSMRRTKPAGPPLRPAR